MNGLGKLAVTQLFAKYSVAAMAFLLEHILHMSIYTSFTEKQIFDTL